MVARGTPLPERIRPDAIVEAVLEVRFEMAGIPEVLIGRLADSAPWKDFQKRNMPAYNLPPPLRTIGPGFRYMPILELVDSAESPTRALRLGPQVLSYHRFREYIGWSRFRPELQHVVAELFRNADGLTVQRLGLRYLNALRSDLHEIRSISQLDLHTTIANAPLDTSMNLNFNRPLRNDATAQVKVATKDMVQGQLPDNTTVFIDVDVSTPEGYQTRDQATVDAWIVSAHESEKQEFFHLLTADTIRNLQRNLQ